MALDQALAQEQILDGAEDSPFLQVMNIHKAKGKQFDGVILVREARRSGAVAESSFIWRGGAKQGAVCRHYTCRFLRWGEW
ncbi:hypothetical protein BK662_16195 [Pseudomonas frederiksbergensis]|uniref:Uncharacterized protein n=1 Tax=Pseudomonas frederiksbergensis TaxID=104087 RepID=A0A423HN52_9PSED|nr:hypothetical protein BK662_16195 [Pseudomonas frederiksbergensis]